MGAAYGCFHYSLWLKPETIFGVCCFIQQEWVYGGFIWQGLQKLYLACRGERVDSNRADTGTGCVMQEVWRVRSIWGNWDLKAPRAEVGMEVGGNPSGTHHNLFLSFCIGAELKKSLPTPKKCSGRSDGCSADLNSHLNSSAGVSMSLAGQGLL